MSLSISEWTMANDIECSHLTASNSSFPRHTHDEYVISANLTGTEEIWLHGKTELVRGGEITIYNPATIQSSVFGDDKVEFLSVHIPQSLLRQVSVDHNLRSDHCAPVLKEGVLNNPALFSALCHYKRTLNDDDQEQNLLWLLGALLEEPAREQEQSLRPVQLALDFMRDHLTRKIHLDTLAQVSGLSKFHFVRLFRQHIGMPPLQYHMQLRLLEARNQLRKNDNALDVAIRLGFYDQSHFINTFRKMMGITPHLYSLSLNASQQMSQALTR
ncbi:AraC family transcriptional regulator [Rahnella bruchi]|uniref:AraC family transcriptional regulator n=1 Tax=Rahnella bruchi TaxID=1510573 RepID=UPI000EA4056F|nr:AraC family transcriptional regulator [Rahnella bruchi]